MSVKLRKRKNKDGTTTLLLDIYHDQKRSYEFLKELRLCKPITPLDRKENRDRLELAKQICNKREQQTQADEYDLSPEFRKGVDFLQYFKKFINSYNKKDKRVVEACYQKFQEYVVEEGLKELTTKRISPAVVIQFKEYLEHSLNGESPSNYFKKFKKVLRSGVRDKVFNSDMPVLLGSRADELKVKTNKGISKDILTFEEIQTLANTELTNTEVKRAFLFSCLTGLRYCDIKELRWKHIQNGVLNIVQQKTSSRVTINLNDSADKILGNKGKAESLVFALPSHTACNKNLKTWCKKAKIGKHITWHCARHSFGTGLVLMGTDVKSASSLLGHSSLTYTDRYVRESDKLKDQAVNNLPPITIE